MKIQIPTSRTKKGGEPPLINKVRQIYKIYLGIEVGMLKMRFFLDKRINIVKQDFCFKQQGLYEKEFTDQDKSILSSS